MIDRHRIEQAFSAARDYDRHAGVQKDVASGLARKIERLDLPELPRILEIGCGTGFLTGALADLLPGAKLFVTDISSSMVERCRSRVGEAPGRRFDVLDGEYGDIAREGPYDLIVSSLAMQWFDDQEAAARRMLACLAPGGHCLFTSLASRSFAEWRNAHEREGLNAGTLAFLPASRFEAMLPDAQATAPAVDRHVERHASGIDFLRSLKAIGAHSARRHHTPLSAGELRRVIARFEEGGAGITYEVVTCHFSNGGKAER